MSHPHQLHAAAAAASLRTALVTLGQGAASERYGAAAAGDGYRSPSWQPGGRGVGGHGDPVATAVAGSVRTRLARRHLWTLDTLAWLCRALKLPAEAPLDALEVALPRLAPSTAWQLCLWLRDLDKRCREDVGLDDSPIPAPGETCPVCDTHTIYRKGEYLLCLNGMCLCAGEMCSCTMPVKAAGVVHIWAPEWPHKPERNEDGIDALRYAITGAAAVIRARRAPGKIQGMRPHGFYLDEANYLWDGESTP